MAHQIFRRFSSLFALTLVSATIALAQSPTVREDLGAAASDSWQTAQSAGPSRGELFVVTLNQPHRRQACRIQSFTQDKLVCSRQFGGPRTYLAQDVLALIVPGDHGLKIRLALGINGALAAAIWGTVVLAAICPACAVATGIVALCLFGAAGAILIGDEQPERLLYLAPGEQLTGKLHALQP